MIEISPADLDDARDLAMIHGGSVSEPWNARAFRDFLQKASISAEIARIGGEPCGFVLVSQAVDEAEILQIATRPAFRGGGIAKKLIVSVSEQLKERGVRSIFLEVAESNAPAIGLYEGLGFERIGHRPAYYARPDGTRENARLYRLNLVVTP